MGFRVFEFLGFWVLGFWVKGSIRVPLKGAIRVWGLGLRFFRLKA